MYIKPRFDIQRVHFEGATLYYEVYYRNDKNVYEKVSDTEFKTIKAAQDYVEELLD